MIDNGFSMGDYNQLDFKESTVALRQPSFPPSLLHVSVQGELGADVGQ
jgi:hypothetical protein